MNFKYHLLPYSGPSSRLCCPKCGRKQCFTPYVDKDGNPANTEVYGVCNHKSSCGYAKYPPSEDYTPRMFKSSNTKRKMKPKQTTKSSPSSPCVIPDEIVRKTVIFSRKNSLVNFLLGFFPEEVVKALILQYGVGTTRDGYTVFYQIDRDGRCRAGKIIPYDPDTGHRIKDGSIQPVMWVHKKLMQAGALPEDWVLSQCLFGEHLLTEYPGRTVALVESEKTAIICAAAVPEYLWLATGSKQQFNDRLISLKGRKVVAFPDVDGYDDWCRKSKEYPALDITVSDLLERSCTPEQKEAKIDIADLILDDLQRNKSYKFKTAEMARIADKISPEFWPEVDALIEELGLEVSRQSQQDDVQSIYSKG